MPKMTAREMAAHVEKLAADNGITVGSHSSCGRAWKRKRLVNIRPVKSPVTYAVALHEIGHVLGKDQSKNRLYAEAGAWAWAVENALTWTDSMTSTMKRLLGSYLVWARRKHDRGVCNAPTIPEEDHYFWSLLAHDGVAWEPPPPKPPRRRRGTWTIIERDENGAVIK